MKIEELPTLLHVSSLINVISSFTSPPRHNMTHNMTTIYLSIATHREKLFIIQKRKNNCSNCFISFKYPPSPKDGFFKVPLPAGR